MKILIIIPCYNEKYNVINVVKSIREYNEELDYIVINDGSTDDTKNILIENKINFIDLPFNVGIGAAVQTGYKYAYANGYDIAVQFDGDGQHDIKYIDKLIKPIIDSKADLVIGSRFVEDISEFKSTVSRQAGIKFISFLIKLKTGKRIKDVTSGYRACNRDIMEKFSNYYPYDYPEPITNYMLLKNNYNIIELGVNMFKRQSGKSSIRLFKSIYYMFNVCSSIILIDAKKIGGKK